MDDGKVTGRMLAGVTWPGFASKLGNANILPVTFARLSPSLSQFAYFSRGDVAGVREQNERAPPRHYRHHRLQAGVTYFFSSSLLISSLELSDTQSL